MPGKPTPREQLAIDLYGEYYHVYGGPAHPQRNEWAWDTLPSRQQDRWRAVAEYVMTDEVRRRINGIAGRRIRDEKAAA